MAWVLGMATQEEIDKIKAAGYTIDDPKTLLLNDTEENEYRGDEKFIAVFVDCDATSLLSLEE